MTAMMDDERDGGVGRVNDTTRGIAVAINSTRMYVFREAQRRPYLGNIELY